MPPPSFSDRLIEACLAADAPACVGLDPVLHRLPEPIRAAHADPVAAIAAFGEGVLRAVADSVRIVKLQSACFERYGHHGWRIMADLADRARELGLMVILDGKRGDIGITAEHYAAAARAVGADAATVNPYPGPETLRPYLDAGLGIFALVRTSNPDSDAIQAHRLADGRTIAEMVADLVAALGAAGVGRHGYSDVGAVVGATKASEGRVLRGRMPRQVFLVPGYGAQGGTPDDVRALLDDRGGGVLVAASRSVIYPASSGSAWDAAVGVAAATFARELRQLVA